MSILGIGVDVVHVPRVLALIHRRGPQKFASRILSSQEVTDWNALPPSMTPFARAQFLAVRWSIKEAAYKAVFPTLRPTWKELTYRSSSKCSKPQLLYHAQDVHPVGKFHVSASHDGDYIFTSVVVETA
ncbi:4'-phosphopantetheinyl transferase [Amanita rubescens]|nr:4'-phosphopantetheinyl transferase [Amanita rubescens]